MVNRNLRKKNEHDRRKYSFLPEGFTRKSVSNDSCGLRKAQGFWSREEEETMENLKAFSFDLRKKVVEMIVEEKADISVEI